MADFGAAIQPEFDPQDSEWIARHVEGLRADGLLVEVAAEHRLVAEESVPYDAGTLDLNQRFRLPD
jgi:hypothetical protein